MDVDKECDRKMAKTNEKLATGLEKAKETTGVLGRKKLRDSIISGTSRRKIGETEGDGVWNAKKGWNIKYSQKIQFLFTD